MQVIKKNYVKPAQKDENAEVSGVKMTTHISQLILICGFFLPFRIPGFLTKTLTDFVLMKPAPFPPPDFSPNYTVLYMMAP